MRQSEPSFPTEGATLDLDRATNQFRLKWGDKVNVGDHVVVDSGVVDMLNPIQVIRLVARHSKGIWTDALSFDKAEDKDLWEFVQETSLLLGCRVSSLFVQNGHRIIVWTESPLRGVGEEVENEMMPHCIVRLEEDYMSGEVKVSDVLK